MFFFFKKEKSQYRFSHPVKKEEKIVSRGGSKSLGRGSMAHNRSKLAVSGYQALVVVKEGMLMDKKTSVYKEKYKGSPISEQNNVQKVSGHQVWRIVVISQTSNT